MKTISLREHFKLSSIFLITLSILYALVYTSYLWLFSNIFSINFSDDITLHNSLITNLEKHPTLNNKYVLSDTNSIIWNDKDIEKLNAFEQLFYHPITFIGADKDKDNGDIYIAKVRLVNSNVIDIKGLSNLTESADGDDRILAINEDILAFKTLIADKCRLITLMDFEGNKEALYSFIQKVEQVNLEWKNLANKEELHISGILSESQSPFNIIIDRETKSLSEDGILRYRPIRKGYVGVISTIVDFVRGLSFIGPKKIARLEMFVFNLQDKINQIRYHKDIQRSLDNTISDEHINRLTSNQNDKKDIESVSAKLVNSSGEIAKLEVIYIPLDGAKKLESYAPPPIPLQIANEPLDGEGYWTAVDMPKVKGRPPALWRTIIRPDPERPFAWVKLVRMDIRQLELKLVAGTREPKSTTGITGDGIIPEDIHIRNKLALAFNGCFQAMHGAYGMMVDREVFLPPKNDIATLAFYEDGTLRMDEWGEEEGKINEHKTMLSMRQNLSILIKDGTLNPTGETQWGIAPPGADPIYNWRSALGITPEGDLIYAIGFPVSAITIGKALQLAGAESAMHLDMNLSNVSLEIYEPSLDEDGNLDFKLWKLTTAFYDPPTRYLQVDARDFFYVLFKETGIDTIPLKANNNLLDEGKWQILHRSSENAPIMGYTFLSDTKKKKNIELLKIDMRHCKLNLIAGTVEPHSTTGIIGNGMIPMEESGFVLGAFMGMYNNKNGIKLGAMIDKEIYLPPSKNLPTIAIYDDGIKMGYWGKEITETANLISYHQGLDFLIKDGEIENILDIPLTTCAAIGLTEWNELIYITSKKSNYEILAQTLKEAGAIIAMPLRDGNRHNIDCEIYVHNKPQKLTKWMQEPLGQYWKSVKKDFFYITYQKAEIRENL